MKIVLLLNPLERGKACIDDAKACNDDHLSLVTAIRNILVDNLCDFPPQTAIALLQRGVVDLDKINAAIRKDEGSEYAVQVEVRNA